MTYVSFDPIYPHKNLKELYDKWRLIQRDEGLAVPTTGDDAMSFSWSFRAFAHYVVNPPSIQSGCDIDMDLVNAKGVLQLSKGAVGSETEYKVNVNDSKSLGIIGDGQTIVYRACQDLVLACNIVLERVALSVSGWEATKPDIMISSSAGQVIVRDTPTGKSIEASVAIHPRVEVHLVVGTREALDESRAVQLCNQLTKLQRFNLDVSSSERIATLVNALYEYEAAMASRDRLLTFKHLYTVLELVTNIDGNNRDGDSLDTQMASVTGEPQSKCKEWRNLNNRTKHIHRDTQDVETFVSGLGRLTEYVPTMRKASGKEIANLLMSA